MATAASTSGKKRKSAADPHAGFPPRVLRPRGADRATRGPGVVGAPVAETLSMTLADQCAALVKKQGFVFVDAPPLTEPAVLEAMPLTPHNAPAAYLALRPPLSTIHAMLCRLNDYCHRLAETRTDGR